MAENKEEANDQSMEEILQSIKRIIADEDGESPDSSATATETPAEEEEKDAVKGSDVLELKDMVEEGSKPEEVAEPEKSDDGDVLAAIDNSLSDAPDETPAPAQEEKADDVLADIDSLLSSETVATSSKALENLKQQAQTTDSELPSTTMNINFRAGHTLEDLVVEALKPELKQWLNTNLPAIVERLVAAEVKKITGS